MISLDALAADYQRILREKFPDLLVCPDPDASHDFSGGVFAAFGIPDDREEEYSDYIYGQFPALLVGRNIEFVSIILHTDSVTRQYYPAIWRDVCDARRGVTQISGNLTGLLSEADRGKQVTIMLEQPRAFTSSELRDWLLDKAASPTMWPGLDSAAAPPHLELPNLPDVKFTTSPIKARKTDSELIDGGLLAA